MVRCGFRRPERREGIGVACRRAFGGDRGRATRVARVRRSIAARARDGGSDLRAVRREFRGREPSAESGYAWCASSFRFGDSSGQSCALDTDYMKAAFKNPIANSNDCDRNNESHQRGRTEDRRSRRRQCKPPGFPELGFRRQRKLTRIASRRNVTANHGSPLVCYGRRARA